MSLPARSMTRRPLDQKGVSHLVLLAENQDGYKNLCKLVTTRQSGRVLSQAAH